MFKTRHWKWFGSLVYAPKEDWSFFGGIHIQNDSFKEEIVETSDYKNSDQTKYSIYHPGNERYYYFQEKIYTLASNYKKWSVSIPVGINARIYKGLYLILGTDLTLSSTDQDSEGKVLYPRKISRRWENNALIVEDVEIDRYEEYKSVPPKKLDKTVGHYFGIVYKFSFGGKLYLRSFGNIFHSANWALGFEMNW